MNHRQAEIVRALVDHDSRALVQFEPGQTNVLSGISGSDEEVEADLRTLVDDGLLEGDRETVGATIV